MRFPHILLTTALIAFSGNAFAQGWHGEHHDSELFHGVSLTDTQKAQMKTIEETGRAQARPVMEQIHTVHEQIMARLLAPGGLSEADLTPLVSQEEGLRNQIDQIRLTSGLQMRQVLTPEQLAEAATRHEKMASLHAQEHAVEAADADK